VADLWGPSHRPFYLLGMGPRRKLLYRDGTLSDLHTGEVLRSWHATAELIEPCDYSVRLDTPAGEVTLTEDEEGVWTVGPGGRELHTSGEVHLPRFGDDQRAGVLRALHQEILVNIGAGRPLPNLLVYPRPWYRDAAMVMLCLARTGNLGAVRPWVLGIEEPFDRNNAGCREPDNLGQVLLMVSLVADATHPIVPRVLAEARKARDGAGIRGLTDLAEHPVYQTKWLKLGLRALGLEDDYVIPAVPDSYSNLFWMDFRDEHVATDPFGPDALRDYPYLNWAEAHFHQAPAPETLRVDRYPFTRERNASQADYGHMSRIDPALAAARTAVPHSWHAAEAFLYHWHDVPGRDAP